MAVSRTSVLPFPQFELAVKNANHLDVKTVEGDVTLREFVAGMFNYQPAWLIFLYGVRSVFVRFLGMKQEQQRWAKLRPEDVPMTPDAKLAFFTVKLAREDRYILAEIKDKHLDAQLGVCVEPLENGRNRFNVITIVHFNNWTGPVYFSVIRPFHHLVVGSMARAGARKP
ncbi:MAG: DUF2867 domain-containing protein [Anaerolineae bacterium]